MMPSNHRTLCCPLFLLPQSFQASESFSISWLFTLSGQSIGASVSASLSNEYSGLISFGIDCLDLLAVQGILKSLLLHYNFKASILWYWACCIVQLSHPYTTTGKAIALTIWTIALTISNWNRTAHLQKIGLEIYWAWPHPSEQDPVSSTVSLSHQEASISLLPLSFRRQTWWKPQSHKTNQTAHVDHSLV